MIDVDNAGDNHGHEQCAVDGIIGPYKKIKLEQSLCETICAWA